MMSARNCQDARAMLFTRVDDAARCVPARRSRNRARHEANLSARWRALRAASSAPSAHAARVRPQNAQMIRASIDKDAAMLMPMPRDDDVCRVFFLR